MSGLPTHSHGMMTLPKTGEVVGGLLEAIRRGDPKKAASWLKFLPSDMTSGKVELGDLRRLMFGLREAIEAGDPAMLKVLFPENRRLSAILEAERLTRTSWQYPANETVLGCALVAEEGGAVEAIVERLRGIDNTDVLAGAWCDAACHGNLALIRRLDEFFELSADTDRGRAMAAAISGGSLETVRLLLDRGIGFDACSLEPASFAVSERTLPVLESLKSLGLDLEARNSVGSTAMFRNLTSGRFGVALGLLNHGVDPNLKMREQTPLDWVFASNFLFAKEGRESYLKMMAALIDAGGSFSEMTSWPGTDQLHCSLIAAAVSGASRTLRDHRGVLEQVRCEKKFSGFVNQWLQHFDLSQLPQGVGLMSVAAAAGNAASIRQLADLGLDVNGSLEGVVPLVLAVRSKSASAVTALTESGADHRIQLDGMPLLKWAEKHAGEGVVRALRAAEMSGNLMDALGGPPVDHVPSKVQSGPGPL